MGRNFPRHQSVPSKHSPEKTHSRNSNTQSLQQIKFFVERLFKVSVGDDLPSVHDNDPLSVPRDEIQTMLHNNNGESQLSPEIISSSHHFFCSVRIKKRRRFVQDDDARLHRQNP